MKNYYDNEPIPVSDMLRELEEAYDRGLNERPECITQGYIDSKDQLSNRGPYKPWFYSRFARHRVSLPRHACAADIKQILESLPPLNFSAKDSRSVVRKNLRSNDTKSKNCSKSYRSSGESDKGDSSEHDNLDAKNDTWIECDECGKWRRVPHVSILSITI
jgi:hypothetical protein